MKVGIFVSRSLRKSSWDSTRSIQPYLRDLAINRPDIEFYLIGEMTDRQEREANLGQYEAFHEIWRVVKPKVWRTTDKLDVLIGIHSGSLVMQSDEDRFKFFGEHVLHYANPTTLMWYDTDCDYEMPKTIIDKVESYRKIDVLLKSYEVTTRKNEHQVYLPYPIDGSIALKKHKPLSERKHLFHYVGCGFDRPSTFNILRKLIKSNDSLIKEVSGGGWHDFRREMKDQPNTLIGTSLFNDSWQGLFESLSDCVVGLHFSATRTVKNNYYVLRLTENLMSGTVTVSEDIPVVRPILGDGFIVDENSIADTVSRLMKMTDQEYHDLAVVQYCLAYDHIGLAKHSPKFLKLFR